MVRPASALGVMEGGGRLQRGDARGVDYGGVGRPDNSLDPA